MNSVCVIFSFSIDYSIISIFFYKEIIILKYLTESLKNNNENVHLNNYNHLSLTQKVIARIVLNRE